ncbi:MAG: hypothetical protein QNJ30_05515 [Kiloniellales bacterium]|nr:hypothetical protein [Kiloniellales bacterium]
MHSDAKKLDMTAAKQWLTKDVTIRLPGWAFLLGGLALLALILD